ncbi:MAG: outer membrane protein transport protein [Asticcacaulis sp.]
MATGAHATDGYFTHGTGAKAKGAGGAAIASAQDALGIAANPASAVDLGNRTDAGLELFSPNRSAAIHGNGVAPDATYSGNASKLFANPEFGIVRQIDGRSAWGVAVYGNGGMNTDYTSNPFGRFGATRSAGVNLEQLFISPTYAYRITDRQSIGISADILVQAFYAHGIAPFASASQDPANFSNRSQETVFGGGFRVGYLAHVTDKLTFGASYKSKTKSGKFKKYAGLFAEGGGFDVPASMGVGIGYQATPALNLAFDVRQIDYSDVKSVGNPLSQLFLGKPFGSADGPGFGWRDVTSYKLGLNDKVSPDLTLRAGYSHANQPIPASETFLNILAPATVQDQYTVGATWTLKDNLELTGYALLAPKKTVKGAGSIPSTFGGGEADISLSETAIGLSLGWKH